MKYGDVFFSHKQFTTENLSLKLLREKTLLSLLHHAHCTELVYPVFHSVGSIYFL